MQPPYVLVAADRRSALAPSSSTPPLLVPSGVARRWRTQRVEMAREEGGRGELWRCTRREATGECGDKREQWAWTAAATVTTGCCIKGWILAEPWGGRRLGARGSDGGSTGSDGSAIVDPATARASGKVGNRSGIGIMDGLARFNWKSCLSQLVRSYILRKNY